MFDKDSPFIRYQPVHRLADKAVLNEKIRNRNLTTSPNFSEASIFKIGPYPLNVHDVNLALLSALANHSVVSMNSRRCSAVAESIHYFNLFFLINIPENHENTTRTE